MPGFVVCIAFFVPQNARMLMRAWSNCGIKIVGAWAIETTAGRKVENGRDYWAILLLSQGSVHRRLSGQSQTIHGPCAWLVPPWSRMTLSWERAQPPYLVLCGFTMLIPPAWTHPLAGLVQPEQPVPMPPQPLSEYCQALLAAPDNVAKRPWAELLLLPVIRHLATSGAPNAKTELPAWLQAAASTMLDDYRHRPFRLVEFALDCGLSPSHVSKQFKHYLGCGPLAWLRRERVRMAIHLLRSGGIGTVEAAAKRVGYTDQRQFWRHCRQETGQAPSSFAPRTRDNSE